jgi:AraC-like DNA-binding protein
MSLQLSSSITASSLDHAERRYSSSPEVEIQSMTGDDAVKRRTPIRFADGDLAPDGPFYLSVSRKIPVTVDQLSKLLRTAGIDIRKLDRSSENAMRLALVARLVETLVPSLPKTEKTPALSKWRLMRVLTYIDANIGEPITLANLAATAGLSRMYFARLFRAATGIRPHEYVLRKRIERAQQMLAETSDALVDIALSVGFQTQAHFTTVFKRMAGNTPCQWRREQRDVA